MSWIQTINYEAADDDLRRLYNKVKGPDNKIDNVLTVHSLRPHTLKGHMALYKSVLHHSQNTLPKWYLETIGVYVSQLNNCAYCVAHHYAGLQKLLDNPEKAEKIFQALKINQPGIFFDRRFTSGLEYAHRLTTKLSTINEEEINRLRTDGFTDGEILEINQVAAYFNYVNRSVSGLGVDTQGDILGLSPGNHADPDNWQHS